MLNLRYPLIALAIFGVYGCTEIKPEASTAAPTETKSAEASLQHFFQVHKNNRIYVFSDAKTYRQFLSHGEVVYAVTRIGAGPQGETLVMGLSKAEKDKLEKSQVRPTVEVLFDGTQKPEGAFYGEMRKDNRIYVFDDWSEMSKTRKSGEATYAHTEVGIGSKGETVAFVLTKAYVKDNPGKRPTAMIALFNKHNPTNH
jgi:hypothetical protein